MFNSHIHTEFSTDSNMKIEDAVYKSQIINTGLVLTEHMDLSSIKDIENLSNGFFVFDMRDYFKKYMRYRKYNVLLGVKFGMKLKPELVNAYKKFTCDFPSKRLGDKKSAKSIQSIYQRYRELGGSYVTIGSDAHSADQIGKWQKI